MKYLSNKNGFLGIDNKVNFKEKVVVVPFGLEKTVSYGGGTRNGPKEIIKASHQVELYDEELNCEPYKKIGIKTLKPFKIDKNIKKALSKMSKINEEILNKKLFPMTFGGEHSITPGCIAPFVKKYKDICLLHFDAHADTGEDQFGALVGHGTPMRNLINNGYVRGDRFLQLGLRGYWPEDATLNWMRDQGMRSYEMTEIHHRGMKAVLDESFATLTDGCDGVFLSVDIDVVDPGMAPGTGTPEPGGMTSRELLEAVRRICLELPIVGIDVVEVAPPFDSADITAILANRVVLEALSAIAKRRNGTTYSPTQNLLDR